MCLEGGEREGGGMYFEKTLEEVLVVVLEKIC